MDNFKEMIRILGVYCQASVQEVNMDQSSLFFSSNAG